MCDVCFICVILQEGETALLYAAENGHLEIATLLVDNGCDIHAMCTDSAVSYI